MNRLKKLTALMLAMLFMVCWPAQNQVRAQEDENDYGVETVAPESSMPDNHVITIQNEVNQLRFPFDFVVAGFENGVAEVFLNTYDYEAVTLYVMEQNPLITNSNEKPYLYSPDHFFLMELGKEYNVYTQLEVGGYKVSFIATVELIESDFYGDPYVRIRDDVSSVTSLGTLAMAEAIMTGQNDSYAMGAGSTFAASGAKLASGSSQIPTHANRISADEKMYGLTYNITDQEYFVTSFDEGGFAYFSLSNIPYGSNLDMELLDSDGQTVLAASANPVFSDEAIIYEVEAGKDYYIRIFGEVDPYNSDMCYTFQAGIMAKPPIPGKPWATNITQTSITINWNPVNGAEKYRVFKDVVDSYRETSNTYCTFNNLQPGTTYRFGVIAGALSGNGTYWEWSSDWSERINVSTLPSGGQPPTPSITVSPTYFNFPNQTTSYDFTVTTNQSSWNVDTKPSWISAVPSGTILTLYATANTSTSPRSGTVLKPGRRRPASAYPKLA